jgi:ATP-dependent DNA ligase
MLPARGTASSPLVLPSRRSLSWIAHWLYELKFDGYRALAKKRRLIRLRSRSDNDFNARYRLREKNHISEIAGDKVH